MTNMYSITFTFSQHLRAGLGLLEPPSRPPSNPGRLTICCCSEATNVPRGAVPLSVNLCPVAMQRDDRAWLSWQG